MSSLDELIHYCNEPDPVGALMLTGEWGCGKTYTIERELTEALKDTHIIVRISLFGMNDVKALRNAVRNRWFEVCMPFLGALQKAKDRGLFTAISRMLTGVNPVAGGTAGIVVSADMRDFSFVSLLMSCKVIFPFPSAANHGIIIQSIHRKAA